jgi:hypothetical protein
MKFNKFIKLLKCGKIGHYNHPNYYNSDKDVARINYIVVDGEFKRGVTCKLANGRPYCSYSPSDLTLQSIESDLWHVEDETLTFKQVLELSEKIGEVIVKRLGWKDLDRKKVFIISALEEGGKLIQEKNHPDGYVDTVISMSREDEEATDWTIVED